MNDDVSLLADLFIAAAVQELVDEHTAELEHPSGVILLREALETGQWN